MSVDDAFHRNAPPVQICVPLLACLALFVIADQRQESVMQLSRRRGFTAKPQRAPHGDPAERVVPLGGVGRAESQPSSGDLELRPHGAIDSFEKLPQGFLKTSNARHAATNGGCAHVFHLRR
mgnify:CR=1 FL=1